MPAIIRISRFAFLYWMFCAAGGGCGAAETLGAAEVVSTGVQGADRRIYDTVLLTGAQASVKASGGSVARTLFVDRNDDIVVVEFSGRGMVSFALEDYGKPAPPAKYKQPAVQYVKGLATITITGSDRATDLKITTVGRNNTINQALFRDDVVYDGVADIGAVIITAGSKFGDLDAGNARFGRNAGVVGLFAPDIEITGAVKVHDIDASGSSVPSLVMGSAGTVRVQGGDLFQRNGSPISVSGFSQVHLTTGLTTHDEVLPLQTLRGILSPIEQRSGPIVVSPASAHFTALEAGTYAVAGFGSPAPTFAVAAGTFPAWATLDRQTGVISGTPSTATGSPFSFDVAVSNGVGAAVSLKVELHVAPPTTAAPEFIEEPQGSGVILGEEIKLSTAASGRPTPAFQWRKDGVDIGGASGSELWLRPFVAENVGLYSVVLTNAGGAVESKPVIVGALIQEKVAGTAAEVDTDIVHATGKIYDQVLLQGKVALITADAGQITRISYVDLSNDIVQVEFSGAGTLALLLDDATDPSRPVLYNQEVDYVRGHASIVIAGADESTNVGVFTVGRVTALNPTLFVDGADYDGVADIARISISSANGKFGGVRTANANYVATSGVVGIYAPEVEFVGPVYLGDIKASTGAIPMLMLGSGADVRITGGDLWQPNGEAVRVQGVDALQFTPGGDSHGRMLPAQANRGKLVEAGVDVTEQIVVGAPLAALAELE